ncbi:hypothetical protein J417_07480 [Dickeya zeae MS1]|nr:hypothetical protein J417_07480 [Dickeya zeae MS1]
MEYNAKKQKSRLSCLKRDFLNLAPLTGIAFASNWLIIKLSLNALSVKTTIVTTNSCWMHKTGLSSVELDMDK